MKTITKYLYLPSLLFFLTYGCNDSILETNNAYPTIIPVLSKSELNKLQNEFNVNNNYKLGAKLNKYGFIGNDTAVGCPFNPDIKLSSDDVMRIVINTLLKNKKFTNTKNESAILSSNIKIRNLYNSTHWIVELEPQRSDNLEVLKSYIAIYVYGDKAYCIYNSWYPDAFIPNKDKISPSEAKIKAMGYKIDMIGFIPYNSKFIVKDSSIGEITNKVIVPLEKENSMELRVTWQIPIKYQDTIGWYLYLDTTTGEIVETKQLIIFN